jgi:membrane protein required for colicin V production
VSIIDIIIIVPLIIGAITGFRKGFIMEIVTLVALIIAVIAGFHFLHWGIEFLQEKFELSGKFLPFLSFILIFVGVVLLVNLLGKMLKKIIHMAFLGGIDRMAGAVIGGLKWVFFLSLIIWAFQVFGLELPSHLQEKSFLYSYLVGLAPAIVDLFGFVIPATSDLLDKISELINFAPALE